MIEVNQESPTPAELRNATVLRIIQEIILNTHTRVTRKLRVALSAEDTRAILENYQDEIRTYMIMIEECTTHAFMHGRADLTAAMHRQEVHQFSDHEALDDVIELSQYKPPADAPYMQHPRHGGGPGETR